MEIRRHKSIKTIPYHNWKEAASDIRWVRVDFDEYTGDYHKKKNPEGNVRARKEDYEAFESLREEDIELFGMNDDILELHNLQKDLLISSIEALADPIFQNDVFRIQHEIEEFKSNLINKNVRSIDEALIDVEIWMKREIDLRMTSVFKLKNILKAFEGYCRNQKALIEKHKKS